MIVDKCRKHAMAVPLAVTVQHLLLSDQLRGRVLPQA
jgi:hypothetical protein